MGGHGSGRPRAVSKRARVESCFSLGIRKPPPAGAARSGGLLEWPRRSFTVAYELHARGERNVVTLCYHWGDDVRAQRVRLVSTAPHYGGRRWWFQCPDCRRRVGRLHLARHRPFFACRACHDLTYESAQLSRTFLRKLLLMEARAFVATDAEARRALRRDLGGGVYQTRFIDPPRDETPLSKLRV